MLRLLDRQEFTRVGGNDGIRTDVRVIAATNHDLHRRVEEGRFRFDLHHRLRVFPIRLPPLRERAGDIRRLAYHFLERCSRQLKKEPEVISIGAHTMRLLEEYTWPGNVRELRHAIAYAAVLAPGEIVTRDCLRGWFPKHGSPGAGPTVGKAAGAFDYTALVQGLLQATEFAIDRKVRRTADRVLLGLVLRHVRGHLGQACARLGISRQTLRRRLKECGLDGELRASQELVESAHHGESSRSLPTSRP